MSYTLAFTTYKSAQYILRHLQNDYFKMSNNLIDEIIIQDDHTEDYSILKPHETDRIKIFQNEKRLLPLLSRVNLLNNCKNDWVVLMDSDNFPTQKTFDTLNSFTPEPGVIYAPGFATPDFNFRSQYADTMIDMKMAAERIGMPGVNWINVLLNTSNYLIPRLEFLEVAKDIDPNLPVCPCEVLYFNYLWLKSGRKIFCNKDYEYEHGIREDSFYRTYCADSRLPESLYQLYYRHR